jgi:hypothetical protein
VFVKASGELSAAEETLVTEVSAIPGEICYAISHRAKRQTISKDGSDG